MKGPAAVEVVGGTVTAPHAQPIYMKKRKFLKYIKKKYVLTCWTIINWTTLE
jgi:hypothetical protein